MPNVKGTATITVDLSAHALGEGIMDIVYVMVGPVDDPGVDWTTNGNDTYLGGNTEWVISHSPDVALLVNAANYLRFGKILTVSPEADDDATTDAHDADKDEEVPR